MGYSFRVASMVKRSRVSSFNSTCSASSHSLWYHRPSFVGIEFCGGRCGFGRAVAEILVVEDAVLVEDECRDTRVAALLRICDKGEAPGHFSVDDVILRATFGVGALFREHAIEVAVKWLLLPCLGVEPFCRGERH